MSSVLEYKYSDVVDFRPYDPENICSGIDLRRHVAADLEEIGAFRAQEDWRRMVGPLEKPYRGGLAPGFSFITAAVPECLPERLEITSYALEFGFIHDDVIDEDIDNANLDEVEEVLDQGGATGEFKDKRGSSGKRKIAAQILREMMAIDPERAMHVAKSWAAGVRHSERREEETDWKSLDEYIPYRCLDVGYMLWHGLVTFGCAISVPEEEADEAKKLLESAVIAASLCNDLFSFEKEKNDANCQNSVLVVMKQHNCDEATGREHLKHRIRLETAKYVQVVKDTLSRTDISEDLKRYIEVMQYTVSGNVAWSCICPRYNYDAKWDELQLLRAEYGVAKYPTTYKLNKPRNGTSCSNNVSASKATGIKRKRDVTSNGDYVNGNGSTAKKFALAPPASDLLVMENVVALALDPVLPALEDHVVLQPYRYLTSLPSKGFRDQAIDSLNTWLEVPSKSANKIKEVVKMLHSASLMLDDLEDNSPLRRGKPSTHQIYGMAPTINSATYMYTQATTLVAELGMPCFRIFQEEIKDLYIGQSFDLYWTHNAVCPPVAQYLKMVDMKTGGLFRMLTRLMVAESALENISGDTLHAFSCLIGRFFQIRDDYQNLASADYAKAKGFAEDLDEGKYSFTLIHTVQTLESEPKWVGDQMQLRALLMKRQVDGKLTSEAKREVLSIMKKTRSLDYTLEVLRALHAELDKEVGKLEQSFGEENFALRLMLEMLKV